MRLFQIVVRKIVGAALLILGCMLLKWHSSELLLAVGSIVPENLLSAVRWGAGVCLVTGGLLVIIPLVKTGKARVIKFDGPHGDVTIQLDSVEAAINRAVAQMPEVYKATAKVDSDVNEKEVSVAADVQIYRASNRGARETPSLIQEHIRDVAIGLLGMEEVSTITVNITKILDKPVPGTKDKGKEQDSDASLTAPLPRNLRPEPEEVAPVEEEAPETADEGLYLPVRDDYYETVATPITADEVEQVEEVEEVSEEIDTDSGEELFIRPAVGETDEEAEEEALGEAEAAEDAEEDQADDEKSNGPGLIP